MNLHLSGRTSTEVLNMLLSSFTYEKEKGRYGQKAIR